MPHCSKGKQTDGYGEAKRHSPTSKNRVFISADAQYLDSAGNKRSRWFLQQMDCTQIELTFLLRL